MKNSVLLADDKMNFSDALKLKHSVFLKEKNIFRNKLNKLYTHPLVVDLVDKGILEFAVKKGLSVSNFFLAACFL